MKEMSNYGSVTSEARTGTRMLSINNVDKFLNDFRQYKLESIENEDQSKNVKFEVLQTIMNCTDLTIDNIKGYDGADIDEYGQVDGWNDEMAMESAG